MTTANGSISRARLWTSRVLGAAAVAFLVLDAAARLAVIPAAVESLVSDAALRLAAIPSVVESSRGLGLPAGLDPGPGTLELFCVAVYVLPATSALGAVLLTGFLGGAVAIHSSIGGPPLGRVLFPICIGVLLWAALLLRDERVRALLRAEPVRRLADVPAR